MKVQVILPVSLVLSAALLGVMKIREKESNREIKKEDFENVKLRVTNDVLGEYTQELAETENLMKTTHTELTELEKEADELRTKTDGAKGGVDACDSAKVSINEREETMW